MSQPSHQVAVLIFTHKPQLEWYEKISLEQCCRILGKHPIRLVCPAGMDLSAYRRIVPELQADFIPRQWLASLRAYNRLKILPWLYRRYAGYEFILTYELDAFVFRDDLLHWCAQGWDYIGAPWFKGFDLAGPEAEPDGVGNSGFSLRRTQAMLRVSRTWRYQQPVKEVLRMWREGRCNRNGAIGMLTFRNNFFGPCNDYTGQEDVFWGQLVSRRFPWFRVAPYAAARTFSFEVSPARLHREGGNTLPFGCHKWNTFEPDFWRAHIAGLGYPLPETF